MQGSWRRRGRRQSGRSRPQGGDYERRNSQKEVYLETYYIDIYIGSKVYKV